MFLHTDRNLQSHLRPLSVLVLHVLLTHFCKGQSQLIGSSQPVVVTLGGDVVLPCFLKPAADASDLTLEWTRPDLNPRFVFVWRSGQELEDKKHESFVGRTSLFVSELNVGNISLKLSRVKLSDEGTYRCFIPGLRIESFVPLVVGSNVVSSPVVTLAGIDRNRGGVVLRGESEGWYPEPEVSWLDGEGHVLSAGPTETVRGPDGLYTVSSRVTVEKRHNNNFTCRVQQKNINQTRETQIHVPDDFFELQSSSSAATVGLAVTSVVCILIILILVFLFWRQNRNKTRTGHLDLTDEGQKENSSKIKTEDQIVSEPLRTVQDRDKKGQKKNKYVKVKQAELQQLHEEKQKNEEELKNLKEQLENKNKQSQMERLRTTSRIYGLVSQQENNQQSADRKCCEAKEELERTREELEEMRAKLDQTIRHVDRLRAAEQKLRDEKQICEDELQRLKNKEKDESKHAASVNLQRNDTNSTSPSSTTGFIVHVGQEGKYFLLRNTSGEDKQIGGWTLQIQINTRGTITHTLKNPLKLSPGKTFTISGPTYKNRSCPPDLTLEDLKDWKSGDKLQVVLISNTGETLHLPVHRH